MGWRVAGGGVGMLGGLGWGCGSWSCESTGCYGLWGSLLGLEGEHLFLASGGAASGFCEEGIDFSFGGSLFAQDGDGGVEELVNGRRFVVGFDRRDFLGAEDSESFFKVLPPGSILGDCEHCTCRFSI